MSRLDFYETIANVRLNSRIVRAWTQNFQWSMGIISVGFLQKMATWYLRATGGTPSSYLSQLATTSVNVAKRSLDVEEPIGRSLTKRTNTLTNSDSGVLSVITVRGITRVGFLADVEKTNIFFTAYIFVIIFILFAMISVYLFKFVVDWLVKSGKLKHDRFQDLRNGWKLMLKGILYRVVCCLP